jgi:hypothetical protein
MPYTVTVEFCKNVPLPAASHIELTGALERYRLAFIKL